ncbi:MAG: hypothetical protein B6243_03670 [Anaerolineaceae bacterium 4572_5.2]|nr:MAG: hypothetical protein B6243_03670 [Anaerolineaceae bacterium 4572_5.2]
MIRKKLPLILIFFIFAFLIIGCHTSHPATGEPQAFPYPPEVVAEEIETFANACGVELINLCP